MGSNRKEREEKEKKKGWQKSTSSIEIHSQPCNIVKEFFPGLMGRGSLSNSPYSLPSRDD